MKKKLFLLVAVLLAVGQNAFAYDFSAVAPSGQTLYYKIIDSVNHYVKVTYLNDIQIDEHSEDAKWGNPVLRWGTNIPTGTLVIPDSVSYNGITYTVRAIGASAFAHCPISSLVMSNILDSIAMWAFFQCPYLTVTSYSNSLRYIGSHAFYECLLGDVILPPSVRVIEDNAMRGAHITSITLNDSIQRLGEGCLAHNPFTSLFIPASVNDMPYGPCKDSDGNGLTSIIVDPNNPYFDSRDNCNAIINNMGVVIQGCNTTILPEGVLKIGHSAFAGCTFNTFVVPSSVIEFGPDGFYHCNKMIINSATMLGSGPFGDPYGPFWDTIQLTSEVPPTMINSYSPSPCNINTTIIVPCNTLSAYQASSFWSQFPNLHELGTPQIIVNAEHGTATVEVYPTCGHDTATVSATADSNYHFVRWSDGSTQNPYTLVLNGNTSLTAYFAIDSVTVTASANPLKGAVLGGGTVPLGGTTTLIAIPSGNNIFLSWSNGVTDNPYTLTVNTDTALQAFFTLPDTLIFRDTTYINHYIHDTTFVNNYVHDTTIQYVNQYVHDTTFINNNIHDTLVQYVNQYVHDTTFINNYIHDTLVQYLNQYVHDTTFINNYIHDTVKMTTYVFDTTIVNLYQFDTTLNNHYQHDTVINNLYTFDTTIFNNYLYDTVIVNSYQYDTTIVNNYQFDTMIFNTYTYDTVFINTRFYDTIYVHDTVYITEEGIGDVEALNAKVYSSHGQIVVEGADGKRVTLYDVTGRVLATKQDRYVPLRFDAPASGTYLLKIGNYPARRVVVIR